jgi:hypothetical protein
VCPVCQKKQAKHQNNKKTLSNTAAPNNQVNKRTAKAQQKKQSTQIYDFIQAQPALPSSSQNSRQNNTLSGQLQSASVQ